MHLHHHSRTAELDPCLGQIDNTNSRSGTHKQPHGQDSQEVLKPADRHDREALQTALTHIVYKFIDGLEDPRNG